MFVYLMFADPGQNRRKNLIPPQKCRLYGISQEDSLVIMLSFLVTTISQSVGLLAAYISFC